MTILHVKPIALCALRALRVIKKLIVVPGLVTLGLTVERCYDVGCAVSGM
jgi:hypothetical protein